LALTHNDPIRLEWYSIVGYLGGIYQEGYLRNLVQQVARRQRDASYSRPNFNAFAVYIRFIDFMALIFDVLTVEVLDPC